MKRIRIGLSERQARAFVAVQHDADAIAHDVDRAFDRVIGAVCGLPHCDGGQVVAEVDIPDHELAAMEQCGEEDDDGSGDVAVDRCCRLVGKAFEAVLDVMDEARRRVG